MLDEIKFLLLNIIQSIEDWGFVYVYGVLYIVAFYSDLFTGNVDLVHEPLQTGSAKYVTGLWDGFTVKETPWSFWI